MGELEALHIEKSFGLDRLNSRSQPLNVVDMETERGGCFRMFPRTQSQCVAMDLDPGALSRLLLQGRMLGAQASLKDVASKISSSPL